LEDTYEMYDEDIYNASDSIKHSKLNDKVPYCEKVTKYYKKNKRSSIRFFSEEGEGE
jgi:hypothetical protein